jgi:transposase
LSPSQSIQEALSASQLTQDANINQATLMNKANNLNENRKTCCWSKILLLQSDFLNEQPLLQTIIEDVGHVCLFLPKFNCELNPIKLFWS